MTRLVRLRTALIAGGLLAALSGCASTPPAASSGTSIALLYQQPAERALVNGLRLYEEGSFERAEQSLRQALSQGLRDMRDVSAAHKHLAFITCAFNRIAECEQQFRNARNADAGFALSQAEVGHPIWGPVYRRVISERTGR